MQDIFTGDASSTPTHLNVFGSQLVFACTISAAYGQEPCVFNPATGAATLVADMVPGPGNSNPGSFKEFNGKMYFSARTSAVATAPYELHVWDGASTPTLVYDSEPGQSGSPQVLTVLGSKLFMIAYHSAYGKELWVFDGSTMALALDETPGTGSKIPGGMTDFQSTLLVGYTDGLRTVGIRPSSTPSPSPSLTASSTASSSASGT